MKIINAKDYMLREGVKTVKERIKKICGEMIKRGVLDTPFIDCEPVGKPVFAEVNHGQWVAKCECNGAETVDPDEPMFYCFSCGNVDNHGKPRKVIFPSEKEIKDIERELLKRPIKSASGTHYIERIVNGSIKMQGNGELPRVWIPGETVKDLLNQNKERGIK